MTITGGGHLAAAIALGAALPTTTRWSVQIQANDDLWTDADDQETHQLHVRRARGTGVGRIAVMIDCATGPGFASFEQWWSTNEGRYSGSVVLSTGGQAIIPARASATATQLASRIRELAISEQTVEVDLFVRAAFPLAVMLGRRLNLLQVTLHEWDGMTGYVPVITVAPGRSGVVIQEQNRGTGSPTNKE